MTLSLPLLVAMGVLYAAGVYLLLERSMTRVLLGFLLVGNATNLLIFQMAGTPGLAPIAEEDGSAPGITDPLPQALVLTAIVISFAVSAFLLALIYRSWRLGQQDVVADDEADIALRAGGVPEEEEAPDPSSDFVDDDLEIEAEADAESRADGDGESASAAPSASEPKGERR
jgi:multicomponent Na+:H+ antiporter subunit C